MGYDIIVAFSAKWPRMPDFVWELGGAGTGPVLEP